MFEGRAAIVSGAAHGVGLELADALEKAGAKVLRFDGTSREDIEAAVADVLARWGRVDILINAASHRRRTPITSTWAEAVADWDAVVDASLLTTIMLSRLCVREMQSRGGGDIINVTSLDVLPVAEQATNLPDLDLYNASCWALNGLTDAWSKSLAGANIRVNGLCVDRDNFRGVGELLIELMEDGRSGENIRAVEPYKLPDRAAPHRRITG